MLAVCMWHADADVSKVIVQALWDYVVGRAHILQWVLEILMQPCDEEIKLSFHNVLIYMICSSRW